MTPPVWYSNYGAPEPLPYESRLGVPMIGLACGSVFFGILDVLLQLFR